jgi:hypothetical protein
VRGLLSSIKQSVYHALRLYPIYRVIDAIDRRMPLRNCSALEAFAFTGAWQARAYSRYPAYMEAWEIDPDCERELRRNLPSAVVRITDSFKEALRCETRFDFINVDTHQGIFGDYCENFEFFPLVFRLAKEECVVNLNVMPEAPPRWRKKYPALFNETHLARRKQFYQSPDPAHVTLGQMLAAYGRVAAEHGYEIVWHYYRQRSLTWYLALHLKKRA